MAENKAEKYAEGHIEESTIQEEGDENESKKPQILIEQSKDNTNVIINSKVDVVISKKEEVDENESNKPQILLEQSIDNSNVIVNSKVDVISKKEENDENESIKPQILIEQSKDNFNVIINSKVDEMGISKKEEVDENESNKPQILTEQSKDNSNVIINSKVDVISNKEEVDENESNNPQILIEQSKDNSNVISNSKVDEMGISKIEDLLESGGNVITGEFFSESNSLRNAEFEKENSELESIESQSKGLQYNNPVFKKISKINGEINKMNKIELRNKLRDFRQDTRGQKDVLQRRLKQYYRNRSLSNANIRDPDAISWFFDNYVVIDYEATCEGDKPIDYRHEIIEFPAVIVDSKSRKIVSEFHSYVRPVINPKLSDFCTSLTGITQDNVNFAPEFSEVLSKFELWLHENNLTFGESKSQSFAVVTDGPWDMGRFLAKQTYQSNMQFPKWGLRWINIRKTYSNFYKTKRLNLSDMLDNLDMKFEGRPHCGKDDARNIARIAVQLLKDGCNLRYNERIQLEKDGKADLSRARLVYNVSRRDFDRLRGIKSSEGEEVESDEEIATQLKRKPVLDTESRDDFPSLVVRK